VSGTIKISGKAAVIGPDDLLVIRLEHTPGDDELEAMRAGLEERLPSRWMIVAGDGVEIMRAER
jgi:hypothetical protein